MTFSSVLLFFILLGCTTQTKNSEATLSDSYSATNNYLASQTPTFPSIEQIAQDLNLSKAQLEEQSALLASLLINKKSSHLNPCVAEIEPALAALCSVVNRYTLVDTSRSEKKSKVKLKFTSKHVQEFQTLPFAKLISAMSNVEAKRILPLVPAMLQTENCPQNLSIAYIRKIEELFPEEGAIKTYKLLYEKAAHCLSPSDDAYEVIHFRNALLSTLWGEKENANKAISKAILSPNSLERSRLLYWAGRLQNNSETKKVYWDEIQQRFPLTYHALEVWTELDIDPLNLIKNKPVQNASRVVIPSDALAQNDLRWIESLYGLNHIQAAQSLSLLFMDKMNSKIADPVWLYLSSLKSQQGTPFSTIQFVSRFVQRNPQLLNMQLVSMLFPTPYYNYFVDKSDRVDPFLLLSVARQESSFQSKAVSRANARGLMQILPGTARHVTGLKKNDLFDPSTNIQIGDKYLGRMINNFDDVELALAAYNAGPLKVIDWKRRYPTDDKMLFLDLIPYRETRNYVSSIVRNNYWYERLYRSQPNAAGTKLLTSNLVQKFVKHHGDLSQARMPAAVPSHALNDSHFSEPENESTSSELDELLDVKTREDKQRSSIEVD